MIKTFVAHLLKPLTPGSAEFCPGEYHWDWRVNHAFVHVVEQGGYEAALGQFLSSKQAPDEEPRGDLVIVIGVAGSGKTTAVRRAIKVAQGAPRACCRGAQSGACNAEFPVLQFDFSNWQPEPGRRAADFHKQEEKFWQRLASSLETATPDAIRADEPHGFWHWLSQTNSLLQANETIERLITPRFREVEAIREEKEKGGRTVEQMRELLNEEQMTFLRTASNGDRAWYRLLRLAYAYDEEGGAESCGCLLAWLDNIDQCDPRLQRLGIDFITRVADTLRCKALVTVRPLTWQKTGYGTHILRMLDHEGPKPLSVIQRRAESCLATLEPGAPEVRRIRAALAALSERANDRLIPQFFEWTCGPSVRNAIAIVANALQSRAIREAEIDNTGTLLLRHSEMARAFVFGYLDAIDENTFTNLYRTQTSNAIEQQLVKPRILDLVARHFAGQVRVKDIAKWLQCFGYTENQIVEAAAELLTETRALLWYEDGHQIEDLNSQAELRITPLGTNYINHLFGEYLYEELTVAKSARDNVSVGRVVDSHKERTAQDFLEVQAFVRNHSGIVYASLYPSNIVSLSLMHWGRLQRGLRGRASHEESAILDPQREDYIETTVQQLARAGAGVAGQRTISLRK